MCIHTYFREKYLHKLEKPNFIKFAALPTVHSLLTYNNSQVIYSLPWEAQSGFPFLE